MIQSIHFLSHHPNYQLHYLGDGDVEVEVEGQDYTCHKDDKYGESGVLEVGQLDFHGSDMRREEGGGGGRWRVKWWCYHHFIHPLFLYLLPSPEFRPPSNLGPISIIMRRRGFPPHRLPISTLNILKMLRALRVIHLTPYTSKKGTKIGIFESQDNM